MGKVKYNKKHLWHYYFIIDGIRYLHGRMFTKRQAEILKTINNH